MVSAHAPRALEEAIRTQYRDSPHELDRRKFAALPFYLQELMWEISHRYTVAPDSYDRLLGQLLRLPEVVFVTLNYDTILDRRLALDQRINRMSDYVNPSRRWSLIKLHGSVEWVRPIWVPLEPDSWSVEINAMAPGPEIPRLGPIKRSSATELDGLRMEEEFRGGVRHLYPALSVPVGTADELSCPPEHVDFLRRKLHEQEQLHLLVIGYSGADREVIRLVQESERPIGTLAVVNPADTAAQVALALSAEWGYDYNEELVYATGFTEFTSTALLDQYATLIGRILSD